MNFGYGINMNNIPGYGNPYGGGCRSGRMPGMNPNSVFNFGRPMPGMFGGMGYGMGYGMGGYGVGEKTEKAMMAMGWASIGISCLNMLTGLTFGILSACGFPRTPEERAERKAIHDTNVARRKSTHETNVKTRETKHEDNVKAREKTRTENAERRALKHVDVKFSLDGESYGTVTVDGKTKYVKGNSFIDKEEYDQIQSKWEQMTPEERIKSNLHGCNETEIGGTKYIYGLDKNNVTKFYKYDSTQDNFIEITRAEMRAANNASKSIAEKLSSIRREFVLGSNEYKTLDGKYYINGVETDQETYEKDKQQAEQLLNEYLGKDHTYQDIQDAKAELDKRIVQFEEKYNFTRNTKGFDGGFFKISDETERNKYSGLEFQYNEIVRLSKDYSRVMRTWIDGDKMTSYSWNYNSSSGLSGSASYESVEKITLTNGEHAYKTEKGVFYPWFNGKAGTKEVPAELIP